MKFIQTEAEEMMKRWPGEWPGLLESCQRTRDQELTAEGADPVEVNRRYVTKLEKIFREAMASDTNR